MAEVSGSRGNRIAYDVTGDGEVDLLLVHGITENRHSWDPLLTDLAAGYRVIRVDLPGHGESEPAPDYAIDRLADDVAASEEIQAALGASAGSLGAVGVSHYVIADEALRGRRSMTTGANEDDWHYTGVSVERDIAVDEWADLREVSAGEACPMCSTPVTLGGGITMEKDSFPSFILAAKVL